MWTLLSDGSVLPLLGRILWVKFVCLGSGDEEQTYPGLWFLPVWHRGIPDSILLLLLYCWCRLESPLVVSFVFVCSRVLSVFSLRFVPLSFQIYVLWLLKVCLVLSGWRAALLGKGNSEWAPAHDVAKDLVCFLLFHLLQLATG